jgi:uncharacterized protein YjeT (DUF2065 family)
MAPPEWWSQQRGEGVVPPRDLQLMGLVVVVLGVVVLQPLQYRTS